MNGLSHESMLRPSVTCRYAEVARSVGADPAMLKALDQFQEENQQTRRIQPSRSPMTSPVLFVKKKDSSLCCVQDYQHLNSQMIKNTYPIPIISIMEGMAGQSLFLKLDICWGYNNQQIKKGDEWKAAFTTQQGAFKPLVMFFWNDQQPLLIPGL